VAIQSHESRCQELVIWQAQRPAFDIVDNLTLCYAHKVVLSTHRWPMGSDTATSSSGTSRQRDLWGQLWVVPADPADTSSSHTPHLGVPCMWCSITSLHAIEHGLRMLLHGADHPIPAGARLPEQCRMRQYPRQVPASHGAIRIGIEVSHFFNSKKAARSRHPSWRAHFFLVRLCSGQAMHAKSCMKALNRTSVRRTSDFWNVCWLGWLPRLDCIRSPGHWQCGQEMWL